MMSTMSTRVSRHCYQASTNQLLNHYDVYNIYSLYSLYKDFQGLLMYDPEGFMPSVNGVTYQACVKRDIVDTFTHHFYANGHGWVIEYINPPMGRVVNIHPLRSSSLVHTHINLYSRSLLLTTKVRHISCMLRFMLRNRLWALLQGFVVVSFERIHSMTIPLL